MRGLIGERLLKWLGKDRRRERGLWLEKNRAIELKLPVIQSPAAQQAGDEPASARPESDPDTGPAADDDHSQRQQN